MDQQRALNRGIFILLISTALNIYFYNQQEQQLLLSLISISLLILRIFVIYWVCSIAAELERNQFGWGIFALFSPGLSLIIIGLVSSKEDKVEIHISEIEPLVLTISEKEKLYELKKENIIDENEYNEKIFQLDDKIIRRISNLRCNLLSDKIKSLHMTGVLNDIEFEQKIKDLFKKNYLEVYKEYQNNGNKIMDTISISELGSVINSAIRMKTNSENEGAVLLEKQGQTLRLKSKAEFDDILLNMRDKFILIEF